jgi:excinuclease ABC subunit C
MKNAKGELIYIGKAVNLKSRVRSYFSDSHDSRAQIPVMMTQLESIDWIATTTESEALILEANLIRRTGRATTSTCATTSIIPYIKVTVQEPFPRLCIVRKVLPDGARYFGPYTDAASMRALAVFAKKLFRLADCSMELPARKAAQAPLHQLFDETLQRRLRRPHFAGRLSDADHRPAPVSLRPPQQPAGGS